MFDDLLSALFGRYETPLAELDARHALAGVLVRLAKADAHYHASEIGTIDRILQATYDLDPVAAAKLRAEAEKLESLAPQDGRFAKAVSERTELGERTAVLTSMWRVLLADGHEDKDQRAYLSLTAERLGLSEADSAAAEAAARKGMDNGL